MTWSVHPALLGLLLGLGTWLAEGSSSKRKPDFAAGSTDDAIWDNNYWLNRLLLSILFGTFITILVLPYYLQGRSNPLNMVGAFACGCLAWGIAFVAVSGSHFRKRYRELRRFEELRYGYRVPSSVLIVPASLFALGWLLYVWLRV
jgi:hypothetical protein